MPLDLARWQAALEKHGIGVEQYYFDKPEKYWLLHVYWPLGEPGGDAWEAYLARNDDDHSAAESISRVTAQVRPNASFVWMGGRVCLVDIKGCTASSSWSDFHTDDEVYWYDAELDALLAALEADRV